MPDSHTLYRGRDRIDLGKGEILSVCVVGHEGGCEEGGGVAGRGNPGKGGQK